MVRVPGRSRDGGTEDTNELGLDGRAWAQTKRIGNDGGRPDPTDACWPLAVEVGGRCRRCSAGSVTSDPNQHTGVTGSTGGSAGQGTGGSGTGGGGTGGSAGPGGGSCGMPVKRRSRRRRGVLAGAGAGGRGALAAAGGFWRCRGSRGRGRGPGRGGRRGCWRNRQQRNGSESPTDGERHMPRPEERLRQHSR